VNTAVAPVTDLDQYNVEEYWTYPRLAGDCEDYVLAKRRALMNQGWAASTLLIAVVRQQTGAGHAVLLARTDRGDLVLDNQDGDIHVWNETPYRYLKRQSQADSGVWVDIIDQRAVLVAAVH
jgi:predicted transglutaminase-like cysteine proteinase